MDRRQKRYVAKDGRVVWVRATVTLLRDAGGQPRRIVGVVEDITEHLRLRGGRARARGGRSVEPRQERVPVAHEPRAAHAAQRDARLRAAARARPAASAGAAPAALGRRRSSRPAGTCCDMINDVLDLSRIESGTLRLQTDDARPRRAGARRPVAGRQRRRSGAASDQPRTLGPGAARRLGDADPRQADPDQPAQQRRQVQRDGGRIHVASRLADAADGRDLESATPASA